MEALESLSESGPLVTATTPYFLLYLKRKRFEMTFHQPSSHREVRNYPEHFLGAALPKQKPRNVLLKAIASIAPSTTCSRRGSYCRTNNPFGKGC